MNGGNYGGWRQGPPRPPRNRGHPGFGNGGRGGQRPSRFGPPRNQEYFQHQYDGYNNNQHGDGQNWPGRGSYNPPRNYCFPPSQHQQRFGGPRPPFSGPPPPGPISPSPPRNNFRPRQPTPTTPTRQFRNPSPDSGLLPSPSPLSDKERNESMFRNRSPPPAQSPPCKKPRMSEAHPEVTKNLTEQFEVPMPANPLSALDIHNSDEEAHSDDSDATIVDDPDRKRNLKFFRPNTANRDDTATGPSPTASSTRAAAVIERRGSNDSNCSVETAIVTRATVKTAPPIQSNTLVPSKTPENGPSKSPSSESVKIAEMLKEKNLDVGPCRQNILRMLQEQSGSAKKPSGEKLSTSSAAKEKDTVTSKISDSSPKKSSSKHSDDKSKTSLVKKDSKSGSGTQHGSASVASESSLKRSLSKKNKEDKEETEDKTKSKSKDGQKSRKGDKQATQSSNKKQDSQKKSDSHSKNIKSSTSDSKVDTGKGKSEKKSSSPSKKGAGEKDKRSSVGNPASKKGSGEKDRRGSVEDSPSKKRSGEKERRSSVDSSAGQKHKRKNDSDHHKRSAKGASTSIENLKSRVRDDIVHSKDVDPKKATTRVRDSKLQHREVQTDVVIVTTPKIYEEKETSTNIVAIESMVQTEQLQFMESASQAVPEVAKVSCQTEVSSAEAYCQTNTDVTDRELQTDFQGISVFTQTEEQVNQQTRIDEGALCSKTITETGELIRAPANLESLTKEHGSNCNLLMINLNQYLESSKCLKSDEPEALKASIKAQKDLLDNFSRLCDIQLLRFEIANTEADKIAEVPYVNPQVLSTESMAKYFKLLVEMESADVLPEMRENKTSLWNLSRLRIVRILRYGCGQKSAPLQMDANILNILKNAFGKAHQEHESVCLDEDVLLKCWDSIRNCSLLLDERSIDNEINNVKLEGFQRLWKSIKPKVLRTRGNTTAVPLSKNSAKLQPHNTPGTTSEIGAPSSQTSEGNKTVASHHVEVTARTTTPGSYQLAISDTTPISPPLCQTPAATAVSNSAQQGISISNNVPRKSSEVRQQDVMTHSDSSFEHNPQQTNSNVTRNVQQNQNAGVASPRNYEAGSNVSPSPRSRSATALPASVTSFSKPPVQRNAQPVPVVMNDVRSKESRRTTAMNNNLYAAGQQARMERSAPTPSPMQFRGTIPMSQISSQNNSAYSINGYGIAQQQAFYPNTYPLGYQNAGYPSSGSCIRTDSGVQQNFSHSNPHGVYGPGVNNGLANQQTQFPPGSVFMGMQPNHNNFAAAQASNTLDPSALPFQGNNINYSTPLFFNGS